MKLLNPIAYTTKEFGEWIEWPKGLLLGTRVLSEKLTYAHATSAYVIYYKHLVIHAIAFKNEDQWDVINGFRTKHLRIKVRII